MLYENKVTQAVCKYLKGYGFKICQCLNSSQTGDDIIAVHGQGRFELYIEAKGATSSRHNSNRHGKEFSKSQVKCHVAAALYRAAKMLQAADGVSLRRVGMALPDNINHRQVVEEISQILKQLEISVFWVKHNGEVWTDLDFAKAHP